MTAWCPSCGRRWLVRRRWVRRITVESCPGCGSCTAIVHRSIGYLLRWWAWGVWRRVCRVLREVLW